MGTCVMLCFRVSLCYFAFAFPPPNLGSSPRSLKRSRFLRPRNLSSAVQKWGYCILTIRRSEQWGARSQWNSAIWPGISRPGCVGSERSAW